MTRSLGFILCLLLVTLGGCKLEHNSRVKQSQLLGEIQSIEATARVEVPACTDFQDNTKPSDSLVRINNQMQKLFPDSEFEGCKNEGMESIASYTIPMEVGTLPSGDTGHEPKGISIIRNQNGTVFFALSKGVRGEITNGRKNAMTKDISLGVNIRFTNDTENEVKFFPSAVFVGGKAFAGLPQWRDSVVVKPKGVEKITLSDVASEYVIDGGFVPVFKESVASPR